MSNTLQYDEVGAIIAFEQGELSEDKTLELFQHLVDNGHAWSLQGLYGRTAADLLRQGLIPPSTLVAKRIAGVKS